MDIHEMLIKCRFLLQKVNSNVYNSITEEEWCDILNITIDEFVRVKAYDPTDNNRDDYEIRNYYEGIQSLIRTYTFYNPKPYSVYQNARYVNLSDLSNISGNRFLAKPPIYSGRQYRIITKYGTDNFTTLGATSNDVGELFTVNFVATTGYTMASAGDGTILRYGLSAYTTNASSLYAGIYYVVKTGSVTFPVGYANRVTVDGVDYYLTGANQNRTSSLVVNVDSSFIIHQTYNVQWAGYSILEEVTTADLYFKYISSLSETSYDCSPNAERTKVVQNRLVKSDFVDLHKQHSRGTAISSPLVVIEGNKLIVFHNANLSYVKPEHRFDINSVTVKYFKRPNRVSIAANVSCDLDEIVHNEIVRQAVDTVNASINNGTWEKLKTETASKTVK